MKTGTSLKVLPHSSKQGAALYATCADFCRIFAGDMKDLYLLAFVLTADSEKAEQCFVAGLDDCTAGNQVFKEWARSWARRVVIKRAIRLVAPRPERAPRILYPATAKAPQVSNGNRAQPVREEVSAVFELPAFERFAFVMSVLEGYSDLDCALLLGCTRESLIQARLHAFERIANLETRSGLRGDTGLRAESHDESGSVEELDLRVRLATPA
jgi:DNA-directed RNA polymerase specialized sigma24 family protein